MTYSNTPVLLARSYNLTHPLFPVWSARVFTGTEVAYLVDVLTALETEDTATMLEKT